MQSFELYGSIDTAPQIRFTKKIDGTYYVVEAAFENDYKKLWVQSAYLQKNEDVTQTSAEGDVTNRETNAQSEFASPSSKTIIGQGGGIVNTYDLSGETEDEAESSTTRGVADTGSLASSKDTASTNIIGQGGGIVNTYDQNGGTDK